MVSNRYFMLLISILLLFNGEMWEFACKMSFDVVITLELSRTQVNNSKDRFFRVYRAALRPNFRFQLVARYRVRP